MNEPITLGDILLADTFYTIGCLLVLLVLTVLVGLATQYENYKKKQPDWKNDWE